VHRPDSPHYTSFIHDFARRAYRETHLTTAPIAP
jgi:hypothetical protein